MSELSLIHAVRNTVLLFPGQGSQQVGMATAAAAAYPAAQAALAEADDVLAFPLSRLMAEGPEETLTDTINAQPALLAASIAVLRALEAELGATLGAQGQGEQANPPQASARRRRRTFATPGESPAWWLPPVTTRTRR